jgi:sporulation protein YlmC with PRC-barrel domain
MFFRGDILDRISEFDGIEVLGTDGNLLGYVKGFTFASVGNWTVTGISLKLEKESVEEMGRKKPMMGGVMVDIGIDTVKTVSDNVLLKYPQRGMKPYVKNHIDTHNIGLIIDRAVVDRDGKDIGVIEDVFVDTKNWMFPSILIKLEKEVLEYLRMEKCPDCGKRVTLPMINVSSIGDNVMLTISKEMLGDLVHQVPVKTM